MPPTVSCRGHVIRLLLHQRSAVRGLAEKCRQLLAAGRRGHDHVLAKTLVVLLPELLEDSCRLVDDGSPGNHLDLLRRRGPDRHHPRRVATEVLAVEQLCRKADLAAAGIARVLRIEALEKTASVQLRSRHLEFHHG